MGQPSNGIKAKTAGPLRFGMLDIARTFAALAVVGLHSFSAVLRQPLTPGNAFLVMVFEASFRWALPFFFVTAGFLAGRSSSHQTREWLNKRFARLAIPLMIWSVVGLVIVYPGRMWALTPIGFFDWILFDSAFGHLWFLQARVECTILIWALSRLRVPRWMLLVLSTGLFLGAEYLLFVGKVPFGWTVTRYYYQIPLWLVFYVLGFWYSGRSDTAGKPIATAGAVRWGTGMVVAGWVVALLAGVAAYRLVPPAAQLPAVLAIAGAVGLPIAAFAVSKRAEVPAIWTQLASLSMGVYVIHLFIQHYYELYVPRPHQTVGHVAWLVGIFAVSYLGALGLSWLLSRNAVLARYLFGTDVVRSER